MPARFILSLDCEGKWGVSDHLSAQKHELLSNERLHGAYQSLIALLDEYRLPATFAFVGLFAERPEHFRRIRGEVAELAKMAPKYLNPALQDIGYGSRQGWHGDWAVDAVANAQTGHELALHGITHVPWGSINRDFASAELKLFDALSSAIKDSKTFIYPRNQVAWTDLLSKVGIEGFRLAPPARSRAMSLLSEFNIVAQPEKDPPRASENEPQAIPAGFFVNWKFGLRNLVPQCVTALRFRQMLLKADRLDGLVHLWLHPENISMAPATLDLLRELVVTVATFRESGRCNVITQLEYCRQRACDAQPRLTTD